MEPSARVSRQRHCRLSVSSLVATVRQVARLVFLLAIVSLFVSPVALLAQAGDGTIEGRVRNVGNDRYLNRARVVLEGTSRETFTNEFGEYRFTEVPAGEVRVRVNYTGLDAEVVTVTVAPGGTVQQNFDLTSKDRYGDDKTITLVDYGIVNRR